MLKYIGKIFSTPGEREDKAVLDGEALAGLAGLRAENFFKEYRLSCSEAALLVINRGFGGGLSPEQTLCLGSGFGGGIGGSGCVCGGLSGAIMALGLFLGPGRKGGLAKKGFRKIVGSFHESFREEEGTVCCRDLIADFRKDRKGRASYCRGLTGRCTAEAVRLILEHRPELAVGADLEFLAGRESEVAVIVKKMLGSWLD